MLRLPNLQETNSLPPLPNLHDVTIAQLKKSHNLLAFSGGGDSTALFFLLLHHHISFDIAIVNYHTRAQSEDEVAYAKALASQYNKRCFVHDCTLAQTNFEHHARHVRYAFFKELMTTHHYETLLTAHHLNDQMEWFLMQLSRGAGLVEMVGMIEHEEREGYILVRPLLHVSKNALIDFLKENGIHYFHDASNDSTHFTRNHIRHHYANAFVQEYAEGIARSFEYLHEDAKRLLPLKIHTIQKLFILERSNDDLINIRHIDRTLKQLGILISKAQRDEIIRTKACVISGEMAICFTCKMIFIAPYVHAVMDKPFKERCREAHIPSKIRPYMYKESIEPREILELLHLNHIL